jgi:glycosyltransferase involved in cell wall biosynthesis
MEAAKKYIVMVGPSMNSHGGIASVVAAWKQAGVFGRWPITYLETHVEGTKLNKLFVGSVAFLRFVLLLISCRVACVHLHIARHKSFWRKSIFALAAFLVRRPVLLHFHSGRFPDFFFNDCNWVQKQAVRVVLDHAENLIVLSESWREILRPITRNRQITVVTNFLVPPPRAADDSTRSKHHILFLGLLNRDKGFFDLLEAIAPLCIEFPSLMVVCGGKGDQADVNERIQQLHIEGHVKLLGWVTGASKDAWLSRASFYVLPSYVEGIPLGILEAMAWGMPVVASKIGGIPDIIEDGGEGLLIKAGDLPGLRDAMRKLLQNDEPRRRMGLAARRKIESVFSPTAVLPSIDLLYEEYFEKSVAVRGMFSTQREQTERHR